MKRSPSPERDRPDAVLDRGAGLDAQAGLQEDQQIRSGQRAITQRLSQIRLLICDSRVFCSVLLTAFDLYAYPLSARIRSSVNGNARKHRDGSA